MKMKLQKILLAVMAVVIAVSTWAFYAAPSPILYDASELKPENISIEWMRPTGKYKSPETVAVSDLINREAVVEILSRYTRGRDAQENVVGFTKADNALLLVMHMEGLGPMSIVLGADAGTFNMVFLNGCAYQINDADALHAELIALLPD